MDCKIYRMFNIDLKNYTDLELVEHFNNYGKNENRVYNLETLEHKLFNIIDCKIYRLFNIDLKNYTDLELVDHFNNYGKNEDRIYNIETLESKLLNKKNIIELLKTNSECHEALCKNYNILGRYSREDREYIALESNTPLFYTDTEIKESKLNEESIINDILPEECKELEKLNILNICENSHINFKKNMCDNICNVLVCNVDNLLFKGNVIDGIIALYILEYMEDPIKTLDEWLRVLKPGGKIGIIISNYKSKLKHKWNTEINNTINIIKTNFDNIDIIAYDTLKYKLSYNIILQKKGKFLNI